MDQRLRSPRSAGDVAHFLYWFKKGALCGVKVKDEERPGEAAINLDLVREAHYGGGLLRLYFERGAITQDDVTFTGENAQKIWAAMG